MQGKYYNEKIETMPQEQMKELQSQRLINTINRVYKNVPTYRNRMQQAGLAPEDIKSIDDLKKLPFTYKSDLRDNYPYGMFAVPMEEVARIHASSGTTGKQTVVGYTNNDLDMWAECVARSLVSIGGSKKDFIHISYGYGLFTGGLGLNNGAEKLGASTIPVSTGNTARQIQIMKDFGSTILCCTPSYALFLGEALRESGVDPDSLSLKAGVFGAEPWTENMRKEIEKQLHIKAYDIYGLSEIAGPGVACECTEQNGMHIQEDNFVPEIIDPDTGELLPDGEMGELVFTCITKEAFPLIRYRTRDIASIRHGVCACGRTLVKMSKPCGRTDDMLIIRGVNVFPSQIETVLLSLKKNIAPYYMIIVDRKDNLDTLEVQLEMSKDMFSDEIRVIEDNERMICAALESTLGIAVSVRLVEPKTLPRSEGKAKRVIDNRKLI